MRTMLVNPTRRKKSKTSKGKGGVLVVMKHKHWGAVKAHRRRTHNPNIAAMPTMMMNPRRRRRRSNPLILPNRRRRRSVRRNPAFSMMGMLTTAGIGLVGGGIGYAANRFAISRLGDPTSGTGVGLRAAARAVAGMLAAALAPGAVGAAINGGLAYPTFQELEAFMAQSSSASTGAELHDLEAELSDVLDGY